MGIFQRTSDMISASVGDLIERFEHPEKMLRHAIREMEESVASVSAAVARSIAAERLLKREQEAHDAQAAAWAVRAAKAVEAGHDDLARRALGHKLDHRRLSESIERELTEARAANEQLRRQVESLREKHASARGNFPRSWPGRPRPMRGAAFRPPCQRPDRPSRPWRCSIASGKRSSSPRPKRSRSPNWSRMRKTASRPIRAPRSAIMRSRSNWRRSAHNAAHAKA